MEASKIAEAFGVAGDDLALILALIDRRFDPMNIIEVKQYAVGCVEPPDEDDLILFALCKITGSYSVESIPLEDDGGEPVFVDYLNRGSLDKPTLLFDDGEWFCDSVVNWMAEHGQDEDESEEYPPTRFI